MSAPTISVVIPTYRRAATLRPVVLAVLTDPFPSEVVVVVDGSRDGSLELLADLAARDPRLRPVGQDNAGEGAARQRGAEVATGEVLLFLDDDVTAGPGLADGHARRHAELAAQGVPRALVLGYLPTRVPTTRTPGGFTTRLYAQEYEATCRGYETDPDRILLGLWAGNMSIRRADALAVGMGGTLGNRFHEDQELGYRCRAAGLVGVFDRSLRAVHEHQRSVDAFLAQAREAGRARAVQMSAYPEVPWTDPLLDSPRPLRPVVSRLADRPGVGRAGGPAEQGLRAAVAVAGRMRAWPVETAAARVLRQVELVRGFRDGRQQVTTR